MRLRGDPLPTQQYVAEKHWQITAHDILGKTKVERLKILWQATFPGQNSTYAAIFWCMQRTTRSAVIALELVCSCKYNFLYLLPKKCFLCLTEQFFSTRNGFLPPKKRDFSFFGSQKSKSSFLAAKKGNRLFWCPKKENLLFWCLKKENCFFGS